MRKSGLYSTNSMVKSAGPSVKYHSPHLFPMLRSLLRTVKSSLKLTTETRMSALYSTILTLPESVFPLHVQLDLSKLRCADAIVINKAKM